MAWLPPDWAHILANGDDERRMALVAVNPDNRLIPVARGITRFRAYVLAENRRMLHLLTRLPGLLERSTESGVTSPLLTREPCGEREAA